MKRIFQKLASGAAILSICASLASLMPVYADDPTPEITTNRKLYIEYMGKSSETGAPFDTSPGAAKLGSDDVGEKFWIGVSADKIQDLALFTDGIYSFETAFEYNPSYVEPWYDSSIQQADERDADWLQELIDANLRTENNSAWWNKDQYEIISVRSTAIDTVSDREGLALAEQRKTDGWRMCTVTVTFRNDAIFENPRFKDWTSEDKVCLVKVPFRLKAAPADDAGDQNPTVLSLVRGPEALDIGSGELGVDPYASWAATIDDANDETNMKNLLTFNGEISLYGTSSSLQGIRAYKSGEVEEGKSRDEYYLYTSSALSEYGFNSETKTYYISVPNETEKIYLDIASSESPAVKANDSDVKAPSSQNVDRQYTTEDISLVELNKDVNGGFNNTITVTAGSDTYTIYVRRLLKPKIELNPGNGPYGMIEKMSIKYKGETDGWSDSKIQEAKEKFDASNRFNTAGYIPDEAVDMSVSNTGPIVYRPVVWGEVDNSGKLLNPDDDMDRNTDAIFVYNGTNFRDPGFVIKDELGNVIESPVVDCSIQVTRMSASSTDGAVKNVSTVTLEYTGIPSAHLFTDITSTNNSVKSICPGIYDMEYTWTDSESGATATATRKVIVLFKTGDTDFSKDISAIDLNAVKAAVSTNEATISGASDLLNKLYLHRIMDTDNSGDISAIDINGIKASVSTNEAMPLYYRELPNS